MEEGISSSVPTYYANIHCGLREGYDGPEHTVEEAIAVCQQYVDEVGLCVSVTPTFYVYTGGREPGAIVGLIHYPRFPADPATIRGHAIKLATNLMKRMSQLRVSIVFPNETVMLSNDAARGS